MRYALLVALGLGIVACSSKDPDSSSKKAGESKTAAAAKIPDAAPPVKRGPLDDMLDQTAGCFKQGDVDRQCDAYRKLDAEVNTRRKEPEILANLLTAAEAGGAHQKAAALVLLSRPFPGEEEAAAVRIAARLDAEKEPATRRAVVTALTYRTGPGVPEKALALLTGDADPGVRAAAARLLGAKVHARVAEQAAPLLLKALEDDQAPAVRRNAATSLGNLAYAPALDPLVKALDDPMITPAAAFALSRFEDPKAFEAFWTRLEAGVKGDTVPLALFASIGLFERHPSFDKAKVLATLKKIQASYQKAMKEAEKGGDARQQSIKPRLQLLERHIQRLSGEAGAPPAERKP